MNRSFFSLLLMFSLLCSCRQPDHEVEEGADADKVIDKLVMLKQAEIKKGSYEEPVFLDFRLGMSKEQVSETVAKLTKQGKFSTNEKGNKVYIFSVPNYSVKIETGIYPAYHDNKLYKLVLYPVPQMGENLADDNTVFSAMRSLYLSKYGDVNIVQAKTILSDETNLHWVLKNLEIEVSMAPAAGTMVVYKDHIIDTELELKKLDEKARADSSTTNDI